MAVIFRNPMPRSGALFVTNPRRKNRRRANSRRRRNADAKTLRLLEDQEKKAVLQVYKEIAKIAKIPTTKLVAGKRKAKTLSELKKEVSEAKDLKSKAGKIERIVARKPGTKTAAQRKAASKKALNKRRRDAREVLKDSGVPGVSLLPQTKVVAAAKKFEAGKSIASMVNFEKKRRAMKTRTWGKSSPKAGKSRASALRSKFNRIVDGMFLESKTKSALYKVYKDKYKTAPIGTALGLRSLKKKLNTEVKKIEKEQGLDLGTSAYVIAKRKRIKAGKTRRKAATAARAARRKTKRTERSTNRKTLLAKARAAGLIAPTRKTSASLKSLLSDGKTKTSEEKIKSANKRHKDKLAKERKGFFASAKSALRAEGGAYASLLNNPFKMFKRKHRKNAGIAGVQPLAKGLEGVAYVQDTVAKVPVVRWASFAVTPIAVGIVSYYASKMLEPRVMDLLDKSGVDRIPLLNKILVYPYTTTGVVVGLSLGALAKYKLLNKQAASIVAASAASIGIALDLSLRSFAKAATDVASQEIAQADAVASVAAAQAIESIDPAAAAAIAANGVNGANGGNGMGAVALGAIGYGDGGAYTLGANTQALGGLGEYGAIASEYSDASPADAHHSNHFMLPDEVSAAKAGPSFYIKKFGHSPQRKSGQRTMISRHAGRAGHRYGWLIKMFGFQNFQKLASLPPHQRAAVLEQLKQQAVGTIPQLVSQYQQENASLETASIPIQGATNGAGGAEGLGYGALMYAGSNY